LCYICYTVRVAGGFRCQPAGVRVVARSALHRIVRRGAGEGTRRAHGGYAVGAAPVVALIPPIELGAKVASWNNSPF